MKHLFTFIISGLLIFNYGCTIKVKPQEEGEEKVVVTAIQKESEISSEQTEKVLMHHLTSFGENNLEAVMEDYDEESKIMTPDSTYVGLEQIEGFFSELMPVFPTEGTSFEMDKMIIENELAYIVWHAKTPTIEIPLGTDTFIIKSGKIKRQTFAAVINPIE